MTYSTLILLAPMLLGAQIILTIVLRKGEICPGQRGRIHRLLPALGVLWLAITSVELMAFLVSGAIFYFYSKVKIGKTKDKGPLWVMYLANFISLAFVGLQLKQFQSVPAYVCWIIEVAMLGAVFANLILAIAKSRLNAFHRLLPMIGVVCAIAFTSSLFFILQSMDEESLVSMVWPLSLGLVMLLFGLLVWSLHLWRDTIKVSATRLSVALVSIFVSCLSLYPVML